MTSTVLGLVCGDVRGFSSLRAVDDFGQRFGVRGRDVYGAEVYRSLGFRVYLASTHCQSSPYGLDLAIFGRRAWLAAFGIVFV